MLVAGGSSTTRERDPRDVFRQDDLWPSRSRVVLHASHHRRTRSRRALMATITVDSDMSTAPAAGRSCPWQPHRVS